MSGHRTPQSSRQPTKKSMGLVLVNFILSLPCCQSHACFDVFYYYCIQRRNRKVVGVVQQLCALRLYLLAMEPRWPILFDGQAKLLQRIPGWRGRDSCVCVTAARHKRTWENHIECGSGVAWYYGVGMPIGLNINVLPTFQIINCFFMYLIYICIVKSMYIEKI